MSNNLTNLIECKIVTGRVVLANHHLFRKYAYNSSSKAQYSTHIIIPKDDIDTINKITGSISKAIQLTENSAFRNGNVIKPLKDGDTNNTNNILYYDSCYLNATSDCKPQVVDRYMLELDECDLPDIVCAKAAITFAPYDVNGNKGIACKLLSVQILDDEVNVMHQLSNPMEDFA